MCERFVVSFRAAKTRWMGCLAAGVAAVVLFGGMSAQAADNKTATPADAAAADTTTWGGLGWGIGVAADFDIGGKRVVDAQLVNGIVRVSDTTSNVNLGFVLEAHYFLREFFLSSSTMKIGSRNCPAGTIYLCGGTEVGWGPFVAIEVANGTSSAPKADSTITAFAVGMMIGFHHVAPASLTVVPVNGKPTPAVEKPDTRSWNFGVGLRVDPRTQVLGDGIIVNQALPPGETAIRFKKEPRAGIILLTSFSF